MDLMDCKILLEKRLGVPISWAALGKAAGLKGNRIYEIRLVKGGLARVNSKDVLALAQTFTKLGLPITVADLVDGEGGEEEQRNV